MWRVYWVVYLAYYLLLQWRFLPARFTISTPKLSVPTVTLNAITVPLISVMDSTLNTRIKKMWNKPVVVYAIYTVTLATFTYIIVKVGNTVCELSENGIYVF